MLKCATDLIATIVVLPDCIDRLNLVIASRAKQSHAAGQRRRWATTPLGNHAAGQRRRWATTPLGNDAAGQRRRWARDCFVAPPLAISAARRAPRWSAKRSRSPRSGRDPVLNRNKLLRARNATQVAARCESSVWSHPFRYPL